MSALDQPEYQDRDYGAGIADWPETEAEYLNRVKARLDWGDAIWRARGTNSLDEVLPHPVDSPGMPVIEEGVNHEPCGLEGDGCRV